MKKFKHKDHSHYIQSQISTNQIKSGKVWVPDAELKTIANIITINLNRQLEFGICHGVRTGTENLILSKLLEVKVVGTDLVGRANVKKMDFHDEAPQWKDKADFIYTNSLDHSYNPDLALCRWVDCIKLGGIIIVHWGPGNNNPSAADCFSASSNEYRKMLSSYGSVHLKTIERYKPKKKITAKTILFILKPNK